MKKTIAILGAGNLGLSIAKGLDKAGILKDSQLIITRRDIRGLKNHFTPSESLAEDSEAKKHAPSSSEPLSIAIGKGDSEEVLRENITITNDNKAAVKATQTIILCVQPKQLDVLLDEIKDVLKPEQHTLVSAITAISISRIEEKVGKGFAIIRAMPNTAIAVLQSMTCITANTAGKQQLKEIQAIFNCVGKTLVIEEQLMQAATVTCASSIAFWMRFIRASTQGGVQLGFDAEDAQLIAMQSCLGASKLLEEFGSHPEEEIDKVTTPQGCTISGLNEMEHHGLSSAIIKGLTKSYEMISGMKN